MSKHHHAEHKKAEKNPVSPEERQDDPAEKTPELPPEYAGQGEFTPETRETGSGKAETESAGESAPSENQVPVQSKPPEEQISFLEAKLTEANDQYLRKAAEFENFRKRMNQEKQNAIEFANQSLLLDLISVIDDFERAIKAAETQREAAGQDPEQISASFNGLYEGISMIEKRLVSQLENKWGLKRFDSAGEPFDPNRHEAIMMEKSAEINDPVVEEDFIKGYTLKERVVRAAKVKVLMPENA
jgi:molecular chaperone GrpE